MGAVGVLVLLLVCVFTAAEVSITCEDVTGHVGDKLTLTCRLSYEDNTCCMKMYKEDFKSVTCEQLTSISCPYTANEAMTSTVKVFIQTKDDPNSAEFTVNIEEAVKEDDTGGPNRKGHPTNETPVQTDDKSALVIILSVISCLIIIIIMGFILKRKCNF
ncbi:hypothetical protein IRJ41_007190 [Triplophysa rosa]|uniref:Immunoglobulin subtype domain-containing protein n=1 Tax=Triplophysa rosa TaxID=992332 RepID=A0A9W7T2K0_TRIRA|nr:hypothetical protein IRJ41_007190 [Triplophysa rosa]